MQRCKPALSAVELVFQGAAGKLCSIPAAEPAFLGAAKQPLLHTAFSCARDHARAGGAGCTFHPLFITMCRAGHMIMDNPVALPPTTCDL